MNQTAPRLAHLKEFQELLANYHISDDSLSILKQTSLVLLVAPSATGRNTIIKELLETGNYYFLVSDNTRPPQVRDGRLEQNGREYFFRTEEEVLEDIRAGNFLEAAVIHNQQVSGISMRELKKAHELQKIAITDIEIVGTHNVVQIKPDTVCVFVLPPSFEEWQRRLQHRGFMSKEETRNRLDSALKELTAALEHDYYKFVVNDTVDNAAIHINQLARFNETEAAYQDECRQLAARLYAETKAFLSNT